jgi:Uma2 family endonuclease
MQWQDVLADKALRNLPYKIQLSERGTIEMSPSSFIQSRRQGSLACLLNEQLSGEVFTSLAIATDQGVKVANVAWASTTYFQQHKNDTFATAAPEICVEIISPSNSMKEMRTKIKCYLKAGAIEVWLVNEQGEVRFFDSDGQQKNSGFNVTTAQLL